MKVDEHIVDAILLLCGASFYGVSKKSIYESLVGYRDVKSIRDGSFFTKEEITRHIKYCIGEGYIVKFLFDKIRYYKVSGDGLNRMSKVKGLNEFTDAVRPMTEHLQEKEMDERKKS